MIRMTTISLGDKELRALEEVQKKKPEWTFYKTSEKAKEVFWQGVKDYLQQDNLYSLPLA